MKRPTSPKPACASADLRELAECVEKFSGKTIVLLGDFVADDGADDAIDVLDW